METREGPHGWARTLGFTLSETCRSHRTDGNKRTSARPVPPPVVIPVAQLVKNPPAVQRTWVPSLGREDPLEEGMETHSTVLAWRIPGTEEPGGLQSMGSQTVGHARASKQQQEAIENGIRFLLVFMQMPLLGLNLSPLSFLSLFVL